MNLPKIIQGGMGIGVSNWKLANAVAKAGQLGIVSGTGLNSLFIRRLQDGDLGGHMRRAMEHFPFRGSARKILDTYFIKDGKPKEAPYKRCPMFTITPPASLTELTVLSNYVEVWLAKEGHSGPVGINLLTKIEMPNISSLYGAMLAGSVCVIMGAGIPREIPGILDSLANDGTASMRISVEQADRDDVYRMQFDAAALYAEKLPEVDRPDFYAIISSNTLAMAMARKANGKVNGFVVEEPSAGGHNAPPRGPEHISRDGEPIYGPRDYVDLPKLNQMGIPYWLAGGWTGPERLQEALDAGAAGVQLGTIFACCKESGIEEETRKQIIQGVQNGTIKVFTDPVASPTGFPFKVVELEGTGSQKEVYEARPRCCDLGYLRTAYKKADGKLGYSCKSEPLEAYRKKRGNIEGTAGRKCLCNALMADVGYAQVQKGGYVEPSIITAGDQMMQLARFLPDGKSEYSATDVLRIVLNESVVAS